MPVSSAQFWSRHVYWDDDDDDDDDEIRQVHMY